MLYLFVLILSTCALVYEFLLSTLSSYLVWNSVLQFSLTIWLFLSWIWIGSFLSRFVKKWAKVFYFSEILLWIVWWLSVFLIKFLYIYFFNYLVIFYVFYFFIVIFIWMLVWFEIPILWNLVSEHKKQEKDSFKNLISDVFTYDYIWAIVATFAFPFILLPFLWLTYTALILWFFNLLVAFVFINEKNIKKYYKENKMYFKYTVFLIFVIFLYLLSAFFIKNNFENFWDHFFYKEPILLKTQSKYQEIVITKRDSDIRLLLDWHLQFMSLDEKRYHDALWSVWDGIIKNDKTKNNILILWGWDWLLARNVIESFDRSNFKITLIDIDKVMTDTAKENKILLDLNKKSLLNANVEVKNIDAFKFLSTQNEKFDIIVADFTDPRDVGIAKLYSKEFYMMIKKSLNNNWAFITQSGNAFFGRESFWCINKTLKSVFNETFKVIPYKTYIPSFWDWGFNVVINNETNIDNFYKNDLIITKFDKDYLVDDNKIKINTIENPVIINYFIEGWNRFNL